MTFVFLGMFIASSSGEILFNDEESDILLHRPVKPRELLQAKVRILVEVSLWLALAFNLIGCIVGFASSHGSYLFPVVHLASIGLDALFCTGCVVLVYQLCLRWFGRERLDNLMTAAQVFISLAAVLSGQLLPQFVTRFDKLAVVAELPWWIGALPPVWFAGFDDALSGTGGLRSWLFAGLAILSTITVLWLAFGKLAEQYEIGLKSLNENVAIRPEVRSRRRWIDAIVSKPPLRWWLRDPVTRAAFLLTGAYLLRDRDVKLRVYPALAPFLVMPIMMLMPRSSGDSDYGMFGVAFAGSFLGLIPMLCVSILQYSQQWQASDIFRAAPLAGPGRISEGARKAVLCWVACPILLIFGLLVWVTHRELANLLLMLPGIIALPVYALIPCVGGAIPLSLPINEAKGASRGLSMIGVMAVCGLIAASAAWSWSMGFFKWLVLGELVVAVLVHAGLRAFAARVRWTSTE